MYPMHHMRWYAVEGTLKVLVTGATGFIGSNLVPRLVELGYQVRTFGRKAPAGRTGEAEAVAEAVDEGPGGGPLGAVGHNQVAT